jgi:putative ABC transport system permease protein
VKLALLILRNIRRNPRRTLLTGSSVAVAFFLWSAMRTVITSLEASTKTTRSHLGLVVRRNTGFTDAMPEGFREHIGRLPGVVLVCPVDWFGGIYKEDRPEFFFPQFYVDASVIFDLLDEIRTSPEQLSAFKAERTAAAAGGALAERFGWRVGDRIELRGTYVPVDPVLTIRAVYVGGDENALYFHREYVEEAMGRPGRVGMFWVRVDRAGSLPVVMESVDRLFANSEAPTKTETERAFQAGFMSMLGDIVPLVSRIAGLALLAIVAVVASTMAMAARERVRELAVLRALGFGKGDVWGLILGEGILLSLAGGVVGVAVAAAMLTQVHLPGGGFLLDFTLTLRTALQGVGLAIAVGMAGGIAPAWWATRIRIADALRHPG